MELCCCWDGIPPQTQQPVLCQMMMMLLLLLLSHLLLAMQMLPHCGCCSLQLPWEELPVHCRCRPHQHHHQHHHQHCRSEPLLLPLTTASCFRSTLLYRFVQATYHWQRRSRPGP